MKIVIQRVSRASVTIDGKVKSSIGRGFLVLLGIASDDTVEDVEWLVKKTAALSNGKIYLPVAARLRRREGCDEPPHNSH